MTPDDQDIEALLRRFQPKRPAPLPPLAIRRRRWMAVAAAAVLATVLAPVAWPRRGVDSGAALDRSAEQAVTIVSLPRVAGWDTGLIDATLLEVSDRVLPDVEATRGVLRQLARP
jgi:hypothetical protein